MNQTNSSPSVHLSTDSLPAPDRIAIWREVYGRKLFNVEIEPLGETPFRGEVTLRALADIRLSHGMRTAAHYRITDGLAQNAADMIGLVAMRTGRANSIQLGREVMITAGEAIPLATAETLTQTLLDNGRYLGVYVPRAALAPMVADLDSALMRPIRRDCEALRLLVDYAGVLQDSPDVLAEPALHRVAVTHVYDLVALALGATRDAAHLANLRGAAAARLHAVKDDIIDNLGRPDLSPVFVAARQRMTVRYMQRLFEAEGTTFTEFVLGERLARVHRMLNDPRYAARAINAIAFDAGFSHLSYFNRSFRARFGQSPSDVRAAARWNA